MVEVVAALVRDGEKFMICQRPEHKSRPLMWEFPGGKVEAGETPEAALARECRKTEVTTACSVMRITSDCGPDQRFPMMTKRHGAQFFTAE